MWAAKYWSLSYWAARYWDKVGDDYIAATPENINLYTPITINLNLNTVVSE